MQQHTILRFKDLVTQLRLSRSTIYRLIASPSSGFPNSIELSAHSVGFLKSEVDAWIEQRRRNAVEGKGQAC
ncbi:helix-turn-helix transcriptional regulator [Variovorax sp. AFSI2.2]|uniref:helix-turn-helix transcriptional regulator n=1 Tax=Variovorax sp. AFSI2.2 TaxID=3384160 RepID=UPI003EBA09B1